MIIRLSRFAICLISLFAVVTPAARNSPAQGQHYALSGSPQTCSTISVSCPRGFKDGEPLTFTASVSGGSPNVVPIYDWSVSTGKIIDGQGSSSITVATVGSAGNGFTATVRITGFDRACPTTASCSIIDERNAPPSRRFDSYGTLPRRNERARLNAFAVQLQHQPGAQGYLLVYGRRRGRSGEAQKVATRSREFLVKTLGIDTRRIVTVDAGFKEELTIDLWLVPTGATPPVAEPTLDPSKLKIIRTRQKKSAQREALIFPKVL